MVYSNVVYNWFLGDRRALNGMPEGKLIKFSHKNQMKFVVNFEESTLGT